MTLPSRGSEGKLLEDGKVRVFFDEVRKVRPERAKLIALGLLRAKPRQSLKLIHVPEWYPVLRLDAAGAGHAYVRVRRERARAQKERLR